MADYLGVNRARIYVIRHGLKLDGHRQPPAPPGVQPATKHTIDEKTPCIIGYLARICEDKGLHLLVEAGEKLAERDDVPPFELHAAGHLGAADQQYLNKIQQKAAAGKLAGRFRYLGELDRSQKIAFLQSLTVFSTPTIYHESKGLPALEAMANAVPVVLPDHGSFPEMIADTRGGLLHRPHDPTDLADKLAELLRDTRCATELGLTGQRSVHDRYHAPAMARQTRDLYRQLTAK
jgi:glycosyltransferase involved in cell wall biosynthesis